MDKMVCWAIIAFCGQFQVANMFGQNLPKSTQEGNQS